MAEIAFLNGRFCPIDDAVVSINDRGYLFGDGVYEVIRSYSGRLWAVERHMRRLERSISGIDIRGVDLVDIRKRIEEAYYRSEIQNAFLYLQITRGIAPREHTFSNNMKPTVLITVRFIEEGPKEHYERGVAVITLIESRWARRDIKSLNLLPNVLARQQAKEKGVFEAIFVEDGFVNEAGSSNIFIVRKDELLTRERGPHILSGITREIVLETARREGIVCREEKYSLEELRRADEVFITGTTFGILGVTQVDGEKISNGKVGKTTHFLHEKYMERIKNGEDGYEE